MDKKKNAWQCYAEMWKRTFDFKGLSGRREYWLAVLINTIAIVLFLPIAILFGTGNYIVINMPVLYCVLGLFFVLFCLFLIMSFISFTSLTVRRLHDAGFSGWYYILIYLFGIGFIPCCMIAASGGFSQPACIYGPPPEDNIPTTMYGPNYSYEETTSLPEFSVEANVSVAVYGPPEYFAETESSSSSEAAE